MDPGTSHLEQLEAAERQLLVFAREINHLHQAERARAAELERALDRLRGSYLDMIKTLAFVVEAKDPSTRPTSSGPTTTRSPWPRPSTPSWPPTSSCATGSCSTTSARSDPRGPC
jgi:hypothetical protein